MTRGLAVLLLAMVIAGCGGGSSGDPQKADRHVCGYILADARQADSGGTALLTSSDSQGAASAFSGGARQMRRDVATLPTSDRLAKDGNAVAAGLTGLSAAIRNNGDIVGAARRLDTANTTMQTLCRALEP